MKTIKRLYSITAFLLITGILNAQNGQSDKILCNLKDSFCLTKDCPILTCKLNGIIDAKFCSAYTYDNNMRWARLTYPVKIPSYKIKKQYSPQQVNLFTANTNSDVIKRKILESFRKKMMNSRL